MGSWACRYGQPCVFPSNPVGGDIGIHAISRSISGVPALSPERSTGVFTLAGKLIAEGESAAGEHLQGWWPRLTKDLGHLSDL